MNTPLENQQLVDFSGEHLIHELSMFWQLADELSRRPPGFFTSALLESWVIHLRNLIDFFYLEGRDDDVTARHFLDAPDAWSPMVPATLEKARERANKEMSHLTQARKSGSPPDKAWLTDDLLGEIATIAKEFAAKASDKKLHPKVREFLNQPRDKALFWVKDNVSYSNVAAPVSTVSSVNNFAHSTATRLKCSLLHGFGPLDPSA